MCLVRDRLLSWRRGGLRALCLPYGDYCSFGWGFQLWPYCHLGLDNSLWRGTLCTAGWHCWPLPTSCQEHLPTLPEWGGAKLLEIAQWLPGSYPIPENHCSMGIMEAPVPTLWKSPGCKSGFYWNVSYSRVYGFIFPKHFI